MRRIAILITAAVLASSTFAGCGGNEQTPVEQTSVTVDTETACVEKTEKETSEAVTMPVAKSKAKVTKKAAPAETKKLEKKKQKKEKVKKQTEKKETAGLEEKAVSDSQSDQNDRRELSAETTEDGVPEESMYDASDSGSYSEPVCQPEETQQVPVDSQDETPDPQDATPSDPPAHEHTWVAVTEVLEAPWDEKILVREAYDEQVLVSEAWDEVVEIGEWHDVCDYCGAWLDGLGQEGWIAHMNQCENSGGSGDQYVVTGTETIHHDAVYDTVHHKAEYEMIHHDEIVVTNNYCSGCGVRQ